jgi:HEAT repeat protein
MSKSESSGSSVESWMAALGSKDGMQRQKAREALVNLGEPAVLPLIQALQTAKADQLRWEAAKALGAIGDARAIPALIAALDDRDTDVGWVAADALEQFKMAAWPALMRALIAEGSESLSLRLGAHHVLRAQRETGFDDLLDALRESLDSHSAPESTVRAAHDILEKLGEANGT